MPTYHFPADAGEPLPDARPDSIAAVLDRLGLPHDGLQITRRGEAVTLDGTAADAGAKELLILAIGNLAGVARVQDRLATGPGPGLLDTLGAFARLPAGAASTEAVATTIHAAEPEAGTRFGPAGSLFHVIAPGESLADLAARHYGDAGAEGRLLEANAPVIADAAAARPGMVVRIPPR